MLQVVHTVLVPMALRRNDGETRLAYAEVTTHPQSGKRHIRMLDGVLGSEVPWSVYSELDERLGCDVYDFVLEQAQQALMATTSALGPPRVTTAWTTGTGSADGTEWTVTQSG